MVIVRSDNNILAMLSATYQVADNMPLSCTTFFTFFPLSCSPNPAIPFHHSGFVDRRSIGGLTPRSHSLAAHAVSGHHRFACAISLGIATAVDDKGCGNWG